MNESNPVKGNEHAQEQEFFKSLVSMALADGKITHEEYDMLYIVGKKVNVSHDEVDQVIKNATGFNMVAKADMITNQKRLINLIRLMWADGEMDEKELQLVQKFSEGLGFEKGRINHLIRTISQMVVDDREEYEILAALK